MPLFAQITEVAQYGSFGLVVLIVIWGMRWGWPSAMQAAKDGLGKLVETQERLWQERLVIERDFQKGMIRALEDHTEAIRKSAEANRRAHVSQLALLLGNPSMPDDGVKREALLEKIDKLLQVE